MKLRQETGQLREEFSRKIHRPEFRSELPQMWLRLNQAEKELRDKAIQFKSDLEVSKATLDQLSSHLHTESCLIEFRFFNFSDFKTGKGDKPHLAAYLLIPDSGAGKGIQFEDLGEVEDIFQAYSESKNETFFNLLFSKFEDKIKNLKKLYIAPDNFLNLISFASLKLPDGKYFCQRQEISQLQTGRDLLASPVKPSSNLLVRAFRTAGAQSVLMTLRPVGDTSSRVFMETFYDTWLSSEKLTPSEALHQTRLRFIENPPKPGYDAPSVWSPYVLAGP